MLMTITIQHLFYVTYDIITESWGQIARVLAQAQTFLIFLGRGTLSSQLPR